MITRASSMLLLPVTMGILMSVASPSMAADQKCSVNIVGVGVNCKKGNSTPSPSPTASPTATQAPEATTPHPTDATVPATDPEAAVQVPAPSSEQSQSPLAPEPEPSPTVTVIKEVVIAPQADATPAPSWGDYPAAVAPRSSSEPSTTPTLTMEGESASQKSASPDFIAQAGSAAPYFFFIGLVGLLTMLITAKKKKLFPFETKNQTDTGKTV